MKFKVDENLPVEVAGVLSGAAHDAITVDAEGLSGSQDAAIARICGQEERVLVTLDLGFADIRAYPPQATPGFIVLRLNRLDKAYVVRLMQNPLPLIEQEPIAHHLWIVEDTQVRIRGSEA